MTVTRDVVRDLWTLCEAGEASSETRRLVEEHLAGDVELAQTLRAEAVPAGVPYVNLPPDLESTTLERMKGRLRRRSPLRIVALALTGLTIVRVIQQTTFTTSPREVILLAAAACVCWVAHGWHTRFLQQRAVLGVAHRHTER